MNGIQEVSGSIPLISTTKGLETIVSSPFFGRLTERRALLQQTASCITCGSGDFVIGVKADGTLYWAENLKQATGTEQWKRYRKTASAWKHIAQVVTVEAIQNDYCKTSGVVGLRRDGTFDYADYTFSGQGDGSTLHLKSVPETFCPPCTPCRRVAAVLTDFGTV